MQKMMTWIVGLVLIMGLSACFGVAISIDGDTEININEENLYKAVIEFKKQLAADSYKWEVISPAGEYTLLNGNSSEVSFTPLSAGSYTLKVTVSKKRRKETAELVINVNDTPIVDDKVILQSLRIETDLSTTEALVRKKHIHDDGYEIVRGKIRAIATYSDGHSADMTDFVKFSRVTETVDGKTKAKITVNPVDHLLIFDEGVFPMSASLDGIESNVLQFTTVNEKSLIRVDVRNNNKTWMGLGRSAVVEFKLLKKPSADVHLKLHLKTDDNLSFTHGNELVFKAEQWNDGMGLLQAAYIKDLNINNTNDFILSIDPLVSDDVNYSGLKLDDIIVHKESLPKLIPPTVSQLRGALPGVTIKFRVTSKDIGLKYSLVNPPEGVKIVGKSDFGENQEVDLEGVDIEWKVPLDIEEKRHLITIQAEDIEGKVGEMEFEINVPKTTLIQTEVINNELIVTDTTSRLYGMKMKGHNGEDISAMQLKSVDYKQLWRKSVKTDPGDVVEYIPFVIENIPAKIDIKFPEYMDSYEERIALGVNLDRYSVPVLLGKGYWDFKGEFVYEYEGTNGYLIEFSDIDTNVFLLSIIKSQNI